MKAFEEEENKRRPKILRQVMYVTQLDRLNHRFLRQDGSFNADALEDVLRQSLKLEDGYKWAFLVHEETKPHLHFIVYRQKGVQVKPLYEMLGDDRKSNFEYGHSYKAFELYLIHDTEKAKRSGKPLYNERAVVTNYDYVARIERYRKQRENTQAKRRKIDFVAEILSGHIKMNDFTCFDTEEDQFMAMYYATHKKQIDDAFALKAKIDQHKEFQKHIGDYKEDRFKIKKDRREKRVIWLYGQSGTGKSLLSRLLAKAFSDDLSDIYFSSSKNDIFQNYTNERIIVLEELRPRGIALDDVFRLFDRNIEMSIKRRYQNVNVRADVIIINSILSPVQFYARTFKENYDVMDEQSIVDAIERADANGEPAEQLFRRITQTIEVLGKDGCSISFSEKTLTKDVVRDVNTGYKKKTYRYAEKERYCATIDDEHKNIKRIERACK